MMILIIYHTELAWSHSVYGIPGMYHQPSILHTFYCGRMILGGMTYLEGDMMHVHLAGKEVEVMQRKVLLIGSLRVIAMTHVKNIALHIFLHHKPGTAPEAKSLALSYGVKPQSLVLTDALARFQLYHITRIVAQVTADIVIVVDLPQETDALAVAALGIDKVFCLGYLTHLVLHMMSNGEDGLAKLPGKICARKSV